MFYKLSKNLRRVKLMYHKTENQNKFFLMIECYIIVKLKNTNEMKEYSQIANSTSKCKVK